MTDTELHDLNTEAVEADDNTEDEDDGLGFEVETVDEIPKIEREQPKSKYHRLFDLAEQADTRIVSFKVEDEKKASARASYLRRIAPDNADVSQRGERVYVKALTEDEVAERDAKAAESEAEGQDEPDTDENVFEPDNL